MLDKQLTARTAHILPLSPNSHRNRFSDHLRHGTEGE